MLLAFPEVSVACALGSRRGPGPPNFQTAPSREDSRMVGVENSMVSSNYVRTATSVWESCPDSVRGGRKKAKPKKTRSDDKPRQGP